MCGRFTQKSERPEIQLEFYINGWNAEPASSYNIAPSQKAGVIIRNQGKNYYDEYGWGLIPSWAKDPKIGHSLINARSESINIKPSFKTAFRNKRCIIPATGFYEWKRGKNHKIPYYIHLKNNPLFGFAGLFEEWKSQQNGIIRTFTIITTEANEIVAGIHDKKRMPVIIPADQRDIWLDNGSYNEKELLDMLKPYNSDLMEAYEVSPLVNSPNNDSPECIEPVF